MRILFVSEYYYPAEMGGAEISMKILAEELAKKHEVHVLTPNYYEYKNTETVENGVNIRRFKSKRLYFFRQRGTSKVVYRANKNLFGSLIKLYAKYSSHELEKNIEKAENFDVIHANNFESAIALNNAKAKGRKIVHLRDFRLAESAGKLKNIDFFIAISKFVKKGYVKCGLEEGKIGVVYNPVSSEDVSDISKSAARKRLGLDFKRIALFVGSLVEEKGIREIPKIAGCLPEYDFIIIGEGPEKDFLLSNKTQNMHITGFVSKSELKHYYRAADVLVVPSKAEPFGRVVIEGQANGCVVVGLDKGAMKELIKNGKNGFIVKDGGFVKLIKSLNRLRKARIGVNASRAKNTYQADKISKCVEKIYEKVLV
ncbi:MAG: glycosyltransferase [Candidatus Aenigmarchaeota archaeon]|nr:glycosyltransferase [Candidatus Aenigmarchaeota archaeon]